MSRFVLANITLKDSSLFNQFVEAFSALHAHANTQEPGTLLYKLHRDVEDPAKLYAVERYIDADSNTTHEQSDAFGGFLKASGPLLKSVEIVKADAADHPLLDVASQLLAAPSSSSETSSSPTPSVKKGVLVFCGFRAGAPPKNEQHLAGATSIGSAVAAKGRTLVYGGGTGGMMGVVATAAAEKGGQILSVIPRAMSSYEAAGHSHGKVLLTHSMSERKSMMFSLSDTVIVLPGGIGTFDETLEVITLITLNSYRAKLGFLNTGGFFGAFFTFLNHLIEEGFLEKNVFDFFVVEDSGDGTALLDKLESFEVPKSLHELTWTGGGCY